MASVPPDLGGASSRRCHGALRPGHPYDHPLGGYDPLGYGMDMVWIWYGYGILIPNNSEYHSIVLIIDMIF